MDDQTYSTDPTIIDDLRSRAKLLEETGGPADLILLYKRAANYIEQLSKENDDR